VNFFKKLLALAVPSWGWPGLPAEVPQEWRGCIRLTSQEGIVQEAERVITTFVPRPFLLPLKSTALGLSAKADLSAPAWYRQPTNSAEIGQIFFRTDANWTVERRRTSPVHEYAHWVYDVATGILSPEIRQAWKTAWSDAAAGRYLPTEYAYTNPTEGHSECFERYVYGNAAGKLDRRLRHQLDAEASYLTGRFGGDGARL